MQKLDYMGVSFICFVYKETRHLRKNFSGYYNKLMLELKDECDEAKLMS
jgi:hypothetical protein